MEVIYQNHQSNSKLPISDISHELRISLTGILGAGYMLGRTKLTEEQQSFIELLMVSTNRLSLLADKLNEDLIAYIFKDRLNEKDITR